MTNDDLIAALRSPGSQTMAQPPSVGSAMQGAFGVPPQHLQQMAGDVVPLPVTPTQNAGPPRQQDVSLEAVKAALAAGKLAPYQPSRFMPK
jgi:hypothetical protein